VQGDEAAMNPAWGTVAKSYSSTAWKGSSPKFISTILNIRPYGLVLCGI